MTLQDADFGPLLDAGFKFPEPFTAKADDGVTDIYGVIRTTTLLGICGLDASKSVPAMMARTGDVQALRFRPEPAVPHRGLCIPR